jgi:hypothetical protein
MQTRFALTSCSRSIVGIFCTFHFVRASLSRLRQSSRSSQMMTAFGFSGPWKVFLTGASTSRQSYACSVQHRHLRDSVRLRRTGHHI